MRTSRSRKLGTGGHNVLILTHAGVASQAVSFCCPSRRPPTFRDDEMERSKVGRPSSRPLEAQKAKSALLSHLQGPNAHLAQKDDGVAGVGWGETTNRRVFIPSAHPGRTLSLQPPTTRPVRIGATCDMSNGSPVTGPGALNRHASARTGVARGSGRAMPPFHQSKSVPQPPTSVAVRRTTCSNHLSTCKHIYPRAHGLQTVLAFGRRTTGASRTGQECKQRAQSRPTATSVDQWYASRPSYFDS